MHISKFQLINYKSFRESKVLSLHPGINLVVGQNNAGKTTLLEGLSLRFSLKPHRGLSRNTEPNPRTPSESVARITFTLNRDEIWALLRKMKTGFHVPLPDNEALYQSNDNAMISPDEHARRFVERLLSEDHSELEVGLRVDERNPVRVFATKIPAIGNYEAEGYGDKRTFAFCELGDENEVVARHIGERSDASLDFGLRIAGELVERVYSFQAERPASQPHLGGLSEELAPDARNLAEVIANLQSKPYLFRQLNRDLHYVLPQIFEVAARSVSIQEQPYGLSREVRVFEEEAKSEDEGIALGDSGTGVAQVLAMLYVLTASTHPRVIVIDEPQSFLHPGAIRKLFEVFTLHPQHQYIISTHVPGVIAAANPSSTTLVTKRGRESELQPINTGDTEHLRLALQEVGARLSDVFGADYILWVEGKTEREAFPLILKRLRPQRLMGTEFVPVLGPDEAVGKNADRVVRIYEQLSHGRGLLPPAVGFIFDRDCRDESKSSDMEKRFSRLRFIKRQMYENYLLDPRAIEAVLLELGLEPERVSAERVESWMVEEAKKRIYFCPKSKLKEPWVEHVKASKLLSALFTHFSNTTLDYEERKVTYGVMLTRWILEHTPDTFKEIAELVSDLLPDEDSAANS
jgi:hypothetical protein